MATPDLTSVRHLLETQLKEALSIQAQTDSIRIQQVADPVDMTQEAAEREMAVRMLDRESALVRLLRCAIDRIKDGSYGTCLACEDEIAQTRLKAIPWAELCVRCQERAEIEGNERGSAKFEGRLVAA